ncbi:hypothetical protein JCM11251_004566 [Rhodosporidiobolus azoricus]
MARIVLHSSPLDFLRAIAPAQDADSNRTNYLVGFVFEKWIQGGLAPLAPGADAALKPDEEVEILITVWEGDELRLMFSKLDWAQCKLVSPLAPSALPELAVPLVPQLVTYLLTLSPFSTSPELLRSISGPQIIIDLFLSLWPHPRKAEPSMWMLPASATTPPPSPSFPQNHSIERLRDFEQLAAIELEALAHLLLGFFGNHDTAPKLSVQGAVDHLRKTVLRSALWVYRAPLVEDTSSTPLPVGFVTTGRPTVRTIAVRGVFVAPSHRGEGIASRAVAAVTHAHLAEAPKLALDFSRPPLEGAEAEEGKTRWGGKEEVCLFVEPDNPAARRAYAKVGFVENGGTWCDVDLAGVEAGHW